MIHLANLSARHSARSAWILLLLASVLSLMACNGEPASEEPQLPDLKSWVAELPQGDLSPEPDRLYWGALPSGLGAQVTLLKAGPATGDADAATWTDPLGRAVEVPTALIHALPSDEAARQEASGLVTALIAGQGLVPAWMQKAAEEGQGVSHWVVWNGKAAETEVLASWPIDQDSPWVIYTDSDGGKQRAVQLGADDTHAWLLNPGGIVEKVAVSSVGAQDIDNQWQEGDSVSAYSWATGFRPGTVGAIIEPGLLFRVDLADGGSAVYSFADLIPQG